MQTSSPYTVALGSPATASPPSASVRFVKVVLANVSPFGCAVTMSSSGAAQLLQPWTAELYLLAPGDIPTVTPQFSTDTTGLITSGSVTATWYLATDPVTGSYPSSLPASAISAQINQNNAALLINGQTLNVPAGQALSTAPVACSNYQAVKLLFELNQNQNCKAALIFTDAAGNNIDASHTFYKNGANAPLLTPTLQTSTILGAYAKIQVDNSLGASSAGGFVSLWGCPAGSLAAPILFPATVIDEQAQALAANGTLPYYPSQFTPGRYRLWANISQAASVAVDRWNGTSWDIIDRQGIGGTTTPDGSYEFVAPLDDWRIRV